MPTLPVLIDDLGTDDRRCLELYGTTPRCEADQVLMEQVADIGDGERLYARGSIDQHGQQLAARFLRLGSKRPVERDR